jgi:hypothetical protein
LRIEWLKVEGARAMFGGVGAVTSGSGTGGRGRGNGRCSFQVSVVDGQLDGAESADLIRVRMWDLEDGTLIYDSQGRDADDARPAPELGGGSLVIHANK